MKKLFSAIAEHRHNDCILVTVISRKGSAPRGRGAQMLIGANGIICGTIGGGPAEYRAAELAADCLLDRRSLRHRFLLHRNPTEDIGSVCGGEIEVLLNYMKANDPLWNEITGIVLARPDENSEATLLISESAQPVLLDENGAVLAGSMTDADYEQFPITAKTRCVIFGAGHCSRALSPLLQTVGFRVSIFDDRPELLTEERFSGCEALICGDFHDISQLQITKSDYVVVMTTGHSADFEVLRQILPLHPQYVGCIGSKGKTAAVNQKLRDAGIRDEEISALHAPIGTPILAVTPEEIAVSIAGEMIRVRAEHRTDAPEKACPMRA